MKPPLILLDFDGVIADSAYECFESAYNASILISDQIQTPSAPFLKQIPKHELQSAFIFYRGIVGPPEHFLPLIGLIEQLYEQDLLYKIDDPNIATIFKTLVNNCQPYFNLFKITFFDVRHKSMQSIDTFMELNKPTRFTNRLIDIYKDNWPFYILSSKDETALATWFEHKKIKVLDIIGNQKLERFSGNKYAAVKAIFFENKSEFSTGIFIDDFVENLDPRFESLGINNYFANWGYGKLAFPFTSVNEEMAIHYIQKLQQPVSVN
jgi:hypothetical protein